MDESIGCAGAVWRSGHSCKRTDSVLVQTETIVFERLSPIVSSPSVVHLSLSLRTPEIAQAVAS